MWRHRFSRRIRVDQPSPETTTPDRLVCAVCRFPGVAVDMEPGEKLGLTPVTVTGTTYIGTTADASVATFDKATEAVRHVGECPFCGAELYLNGLRGSGLRRR